MNDAITGKNFSGFRHTAKTCRAIQSGPPKSILHGNGFAGIKADAHTQSRKIFRS
ncbi:MAG: hypothetical protein NVSMB62_26240 [Acidobacteriaceae bacterium]